MEDAIARRGLFELGITVSDIEVVLPDFRYRAVDASGIVENEVCPVYLARTTSDPVINHDEVAEWQWADPLALGESIRLTPWAFSPWLVLQARRLPFLGGTAPVSESTPSESALVESVA